jgi:hypothetical protein
MQEKPLFHNETKANSFFLVRQFGNIVETAEGKKNMKTNFQAAFSKRASTKKTCALFETQPQP